MQIKIKNTSFTFQFDKKFYFLFTGDTTWARHPETLLGENINSYNLSRSDFQIMLQEPKKYMPFLLVLPEAYSKVIIRDTKIYV